MVNRKSSTYSIVVAGHMNPAIHHPAWYRQVGLISLEDVIQQDLPATPEVQFGNQGSTAISVSLPITGFETRAYTISCNPARWDIKTHDRDSLDLLVSMAGRVFDEILPHTPVSAFGLNTEFIFDSEGKDAGQVISRLLTRLPLGTQFSDASSGEFRITQRTPKCIDNLYVRRGREPSDLVFYRNLHYPIDASNIQHFSLKDLVEPEFKSKCDEAEKAADTMAESILIGR